MPSLLQQAARHQAETTSDCQHADQELPQPQACSFNHLLGTPKRAAIRRNGSNPNGDWSLIASSFVEKVSQQKFANLRRNDACASRGYLGDLWGKGWGL